MNEVEVTNIFKRYSDKKQRVIKSPAFFFSAAIWSHLTCSWPGLNYTRKAKYKTLMDKYTKITFPLQQHLAFLKDLFFVFVSFVLLAICI